MLHMNLQKDPWEAHPYVFSQEADDCKSAEDGNSQLWQGEKSGAQETEWETDCDITWHTQYIFTYLVALA